MWVMPEVQKIPYKQDRIFPFEIIQTEIIQNPLSLLITQLVESSFKLHIFNIYFQYYVNETCIRTVYESALLI